MIKPAESTDPIAQWIRDLQQPRFSQWPQVKWDCSADSMWILVDTTPLGFSCEALKRANEGSSLTLSCQGSVLRTMAVKGLCEKTRAPVALLAKLRLPSEAGLLVKGEGGVLGANSGRYPSMSSQTLVEFHSEAPWDLSAPDFRPWLKAATEYGLVGLDLRWADLPARSDESANRQDLSLLKQYLSKLREPTGMPVFLSLNFPALETPREGLNEKAKRRPPFINLTHKYKTEPYKSACEYAARWLRTRQVMDSTDLDEAKRWNLECVFSWAWDPREEALLTVTRLPLPLMTAASGLLVSIVSPEDALSPSLVQNILSAQ
jgi:hypothetical protein